MCVKAYFSILFDVIYFMVASQVVGQLANLFWELEYLQHPAVTPTMELAKLALVTSRDEDEDEVDKGGTESSNDTDATLVEDASSRVATSDQLRQSPLQSPNTVLGKRLRGEVHQQDAMEIDTSQLDEVGFVMVPNPAFVRRSSAPLLPSETSSSKTPERPKTSATMDVEMLDSALPADTVVKPASTRKPTAASENGMLFGK